MLLARPLRSILFGLGGLVLLAACSSGDGREPVSVGGVAMTGIGPGLSVVEALASDLDGPLLVNGAIVIRDGETRLCELLLESFPPQCGGASLIVDGYDRSSASALSEEGGIVWSDGPVQVLGTIEGNHLVVATLSQ